MKDTDRGCRAKDRYSCDALSGLRLLILCISQRFAPLTGARIGLRLFRAPRFRGILVAPLAGLNELFGGVRNPTLRALTGARIGHRCFALIKGFFCVGIQRRHNRTRVIHGGVKYSRILWLEKPWKAGFLRFGNGRS